MTLSSALNTAKSSLVAIQTQTAIASRNVANYNNAGATRKYANVVTGPDGRVEVRSVAQSQNSILFRNMLDTNASLGRSSAVLEGLQRINERIGDTDAAGSPAALIGRLSDALKSYAVSPSNANFAATAVQAAQDLATNLNMLSDSADIVRRDADDQLALAAEDMNKILADIRNLNEEVVAGTKARIDVTDFVDRRDQAVARLSDYVGVTAQIRGDNDLMLHTNSGVTLFDRSARLVEYTVTAPLAPGLPGNAMRIDGTVVTGANAFMPVRDGKVAGLAELRDETMVAFQTQLDETARGLIQAFGETRAGGLDPRAGLFTGTTVGGPSIAAAGTFDAASFAGAAGDVLSFDVSFAGRTYSASHTLTAAEVAAINGASGASAYEAMLRDALAGAVPAVPAGALTPTVGADGSIAFRTTQNDMLGLSIANVRMNGVADPAGAGGLQAAQSVDAFPGLAGRLRLAADAAATPTLLRDGGFNGAAYKANASGAAGFTDRINALVAELGETRSFGAAGVLEKGSLAAFASSSVSWLQATRSQKVDEAEYRETLLAKTQETLSDETGVNLETELTQLLDLQRAFQASSKLISTVDEMMAALLQAI